MTHASGTIRIAAAVVVVTALMACSDGTSPTSPSEGATVEFDYRASTSVSPDLSPSMQACVNGVGRTHIHLSWRNFDRIDMQAVGTDLWQITFTDVPVAERLSIRRPSRDGAPGVRTQNPTIRASKTTKNCLLSVLPNLSPYSDVRRKGA